MTGRANERTTRLRTVPLDALASDEIDTWLALRASNPQLDSPYFHPGFAQAVHAAGLDVTVALAREETGALTAVLPYHREGTLLRPAGWPGADFQGPVHAPGTSFRPLALLSGGVRGFAFDHLVECGTDFQPWVEGRRVSPFVDVSGGLDGYLGRASRSGKDNLRQARRRAARAAHEVGPIRFAARTVDGRLLDQVIELKRAQYAGSGAADFFADARRRTLAHRLLNTTASSFGGILSTVHAGPRLLAAHFGLRADHVLHWWFPVYDPAFAHLSPGWILLRELITSAPELGITRIDLGRGEDEYKRRARTGQTMVSHGLVTRSSLRRTLRIHRGSLLAAVKSSPLGPGLRRVARQMRRHRTA